MSSLKQLIVLGCGANGVAVVARGKGFTREELACTCRGCQASAARLKGMQAIAGISATITLHAGPGAESKDSVQDLVYQDCLNAMAFCLDWSQHKKYHKIRHRLARYFKIFTALSLSFMQFL